MPSDKQFWTASAGADARMTRRVDCQAGYETKLSTEWLRRLAGAGGSAAIIRAQKAVCMRKSKRPRDRRIVWRYGDDLCRVTDAPILDRYDPVAQSLPLVGHSGDQCSRFDLKGIGQPLVMESWCILG